MVLEYKQIGKADKLLLKRIKEWEEDPRWLQVETHVNLGQMEKAIEVSEQINGDHPNLTTADLE